MECNKVDLYEYFGIAKPEGARCVLEYCLHSESEKYYPGRVHPAMISVAGGGYSGIYELEGAPIGASYFGKGYQMFNLQYSVAPLHYPTQLIEGAMAVAYIRKNAKKLRVKPDAIAAAGFSAGGHLVGMMGNLTGEPEVKAALGEDAALARPDAIILGYPVITSGEFAHKGSIRNLTGGDENLVEKISLEKRVTSASCPAFLWCTQDDEQVPAQNTLLMAWAYQQAGVPYTLHVYESGPHGMGLANRLTTSTLKSMAPDCVENHIKPHMQTWFDMSVTWLEQHGFCVED